MPEKYRVLPADRVHPDRRLLAEQRREIGDRLLAGAIDMHVEKFAQAFGRIEPEQHQLVLAERRRQLRDARVLCRRHVHSQLRKLTTPSRGGRISVAQTVPCSITYNLLVNEPLTGPGFRSPGVQLSETRS